MKNFYPTYLYVKTHNVTGLKYFGKTTGDPFSYRGSGKYWLEHLKIHGNDVSTNVIGFFENKDECVTTALSFSNNHNIVYAVNEDNKKTWANQIVENGIDGGAARYGQHSAETKKKISDAQIGKNISDETRRKIKKARKMQDMSHMKKPKSVEQKLKISQSLTGRTRSPESIKKTADKLRGRPRPDVADRLRGVKKSPETIVKMKAAQQLKGPLSEETKAKIREARKQQEFSKETKEKLKGMVVVVNEQGMIKRITKQEFYSSENTEWVFHNSNEGKRRKGVC